MGDDWLFDFLATLILFLALLAFFSAWFCLLARPQWFWTTPEPSAGTNSDRLKRARMRATKPPLAILEFDVTAADIDRGVRFSTTNCPIALALQRCYPEFSEISVGKCDVLVLRCAVERIAGRLTQRYWHDEYAYDDMTRSKNLAFDVGEDIKPFRARLTFVRSLPTDPPKTRDPLVQAAAEADAQPASVAGPAAMPSAASRAASAGPGALIGAAVPYAPPASFYSVAAGDDDNGDDAACGDLLRLVGSWTPDDDDEEDYGDYDIDTFDLSGGPSGMSRHDLTDLIERLDQFEERCGVRLEALSAFLDDECAIGTFGLIVCGELWARKGHRLSHDVEVSIVAYDAQSRVVGKGHQEIESHRFNSFEAFEIYATVPVRTLSKIRVLTK